MKKKSLQFTLQKKSLLFREFPRFFSPDHASMAAKYFISSYFFPLDVSANCRNESEKSPEQRRASNKKQENFYAFV